MRELDPGHKMRNECPCIKVTAWTRHQSSRLAEGCCAAQEDAWPMLHGGHLWAPHRLIRVSVAASHTTVQPLTLPWLFPRPSQASLLSLLNKCPVQIFIWESSSQESGLSWMNKTPIPISGLSFLLSLPWDSELSLLKVVFRSCYCFHFLGCAFFHMYCLPVVSRGCKCLVICKFCLQRLMWTLLLSPDSAVASVWPTGCMVNSSSSNKHLRLRKPCWSLHLVPSPLNPLLQPLLTPMGLLIPGPAVCPCFWICSFFFLKNSLRITYVRSRGERMTPGSTPSSGLRSPAQSSINRSSC